MIEGINELFKTVVDSLSKHPFATLSTILIAIVLYIGYLTLDRIETIVIPPSLEATRFHEQLAASEQINTAIHNLIIDVDADSIVLRQFHNGKHDLTGIPFTKSSVTFYEARDSSKSFEEENEPISTMSTSLSRVWRRIDNPECIVLVDYGIDKTTKSYMAENELGSVIVCPMVNLLNYPVGTLTVGFKRKDPGQGTVDKIQTIATQVTGYLNGSK